jgi:RHS repeat-associated protein
VTANSDTYAYNANGNLVSKTDASGSWSYTWDYENRLKQASKAGGVTVTYAYDAFGRRIQRTSSTGSTTKFVYDGPDVIRDLDAGGATIADYLNSSGVDNKLRMIAGGATSYFAADHLGTTRALTDASGSLTSTLNYDSFGSVTNGGAASRYTYTGREIDSDNGLLYYRARWYDPGQGRFISEDPIGFDGGQNWYAYVENDPVGSDDPSGLQRLPRSQTGTRPCNPAEIAACVKYCGPRGMESCRISQTFRIVRWKNGKSLWRWVDGPMSCSCNDCDDPKVPVPIPRRLNQPGLDELRMQEEAARQMEKFWTKILIGDIIIGAVLLAPEGFIPALLGNGARGAPRIAPRPMPVPRPLPVPAH